jgi:hypothetical protein
MVKPADESTRWLAYLRIVTRKMRARTGFANTAKDAVVKLAMVYTPQGRNVLLSSEAWTSNSLSHWVRPLLKARPVTIHEELRIISNV